MKAIFSKIPKKEMLNRTEDYKRKHLSAHIFFSIWYWIAASVIFTPGLLFHLYSSFLGLYLLISSRLEKKFIGAMIVFPMDSFRYFEFDFLWKSFSAHDALGKYLDISSPRLFSVRALMRHTFDNAVLINPVAADLRLTERLIDACGLSSRCQFRNCLLHDFDAAQASFDTIVCISVIEHIPGEGDRDAMRRMWELLRPGGRLLLSVPCAREALEEYIDINEYELLTADENNFVFGQRLYNEQLLQERIYCITGRPARFAIFGEKADGTFIKNRADKFAQSHYPYWREPYMMGREYKYFGSPDDLPGWGVIAMEFIKK